MQIFNSLGSNYNFSFVLLALQQIFFNRAADIQKLEQKLKAIFPGEVVLVYKGRDAIEYALRSFGIEHNDQVLTQAFACYAIEEAITRTGAVPLYVDIEADTLNLSVKTLAVALKKAKQAKAVLIQHTLGTPAEIEKIIVWAKQHNLLVIEDLAQSMGGTMPNGELLGSKADVVILSFGRDKILDGVTGGACILRQPAPHSISVSQTVGQQQIIKDLFYPLLTWKIRHTNQLGLGKIIFRLAKRLGLLTSPIISPTTEMAALPPQIAPLILKQLDGLSAQIQHRRKLSQIYQEQLPGHHTQSKEATMFGSNQRFWVQVPQADSILKTLTKKGIFLTDRWYRHPVDCGSLGCNSLYQKGDCPMAEKLSREIINLPTHRYITPETAKKISQALLAGLLKEKA